MMMCVLALCGLPLCAPAAQPHESTQPNTQLSQQPLSLHSSESGELTRAPSDEIGPPRLKGN